RRKSPKACLYCRGRKIRCDVSHCNGPCTNCHLDNEKCIVAAKASRNGSLIEATDKIETEPFMKPNDTTKQGHVAGPENPDTTGTLGDGSSAAPTSSAQTLRSVIGEVPRRNPLGFGTDIIYTHFPFLKVFNLRSIAPEDVNYLEVKGCFKVPTQPFLDEFMQQYFLYAHPLLPVVHETQFWDIYRQIPNEEGSDGDSQAFPLLVFQAMLFVACSFVSKDTIKALGFASIQHARSVFYHRTKALYDFDSERSPLYVAQAALLLSYQSPSFDQAASKPDTFWLSIAIGSALRAQAHQYLSTTRKIGWSQEAKRHNALKRLWWCCVVHDRILAISSRRSIQITRAHLDMHPDLGFDDDDLADEIYGSKVYDPPTKQRFIGMFTKLVEMCLLLTDVCPLLFPLDEGLELDTAIIDTEATTVQDCTVALSQWYESATLQFPDAGGKDATKKRILPDPVMVNATLMYIYYHSIRASLSHHQMLEAATAMPTSPDHSESASNEYYNLQAAVSGITGCKRELIRLGLSRYLPASAIYCTALPLLLHIIDFRLSKGTSKVQLNLLIEAMRVYESQYEGVQWVGETIQFIMELPQLSSLVDNISQPNKKWSLCPPLATWTDILACQPNCYLQLALTMDFSFSQGRLPGNGDFPPRLQ
ncbi:fungal-specific transcription factor domain-containing protein, partial [Ilyonectria robusta]|uniref:fungal-specific transcription factor domain-containing protein n=1 Tax=Ilyonectria robusta TaxID=1079257 RepID=UPI001E8E6309